MKPARKRPAPASARKRRRPYDIPPRPVAVLHAPLPGLDIPWRINTTSNANGHWRTRHRLAKQQRKRIADMLRCYIQLGEWSSAVVHLTRVGRGTLDDDNLQSAFKHVRDGIADWLGIDDADPRVRWVYEPQQRADEYAIKIEFEVLP